MSTDAAFTPGARVMLTPDGYQSLRRMYGRYYDGELPQPGDEGTISPEPAPGDSFYVVFDGRENPPTDPGFLLGPDDVISPDAATPFGPNLAHRTVESLLSARNKVERMTRAQLVEVSISLLGQLQGDNAVLGVDPVTSVEAVLDEVICAARQRALRKTRSTYRRGRT